MYSILYRQTEKGYVYIFKKYPKLGSGMIFENFGKNKKKGKLKIPAFLL